MQTTVAAFDVESSRIPEVHAKRGSRGFKPVVIVLAAALAVCFVVAVNMGAAQAPATTTSSAPTSLYAACADETPDCPDYAEEYGCTAELEMPVGYGEVEVIEVYQICPATCGLCPTSPAAASNPTEAAAADASQGEDSCSDEITMPINQCLDIFSASLEDINLITEAVSGGSASSTSAVDGIAKPIMRALVGASSLFKDLGTLNMCLGTFKGETITEPECDTSGTELSDMATDGCKWLPLNRERDYTVMSVGVAQPILDAMGLCSTESEEPVSFCMAYGECENGLPTYAIQISGPLFGCMSGNPEVGVATGGVGEALGEALSLGLTSIGFGLSAIEWRLPNGGL